MLLNKTTKVIILLKSLFRLQLTDAPPTSATKNCLLMYFLFREFTLTIITCNFTINLFKTMSEENKETANAKVQITMKIDLDVLNYFKERASEPNSAPYQTQINNELRVIMEKEKAKGKGKKAKDEFEDLLSNKKFIKALAKEVKKLG